MKKYYVSFHYIFQFKSRFSYQHALLRANKLFLIFANTCGYILVIDTATSYYVTDYKATSF